MLHRDRLRVDAHTLACWGVLALSFAAYLWTFLPLIPADGMSMGHDYSIHFPSLLAGHYWFLKNGFWATPWFSPAQCGGIPFFPDFNFGYFAFPQWATFALGPIAAVRATFVVFAALGAVGCYLLLRERYAVGPGAAVTAAVLFLFSGFYTYRMAVGHMASSHPYVLTPWLAWALLAPPAATAGRIASVCLAAWPAVAGGLFLACMVQAGMVHVGPCAVLAVVVMLLVHGQIHGHRSRPWVLFAAALLLCTALSASRLVAGAALFESFPRTLYALPGFPSAWDLVKTVCAVLFWRVSAEGAMGRMKDIVFNLPAHEWEYGLGPAALLLLAAGAAAGAARFCGAPQPLARAARSLPAWMAVAIILALPLLINWHEPRWTALLKSLPYFGSASTLTRWFALYVPVLALLAGLAMQAVAPARRGSLAGAAIVAIATVGWNLQSDKTYYTGQQYDGRAIDGAWRAARSAEQVPPISQIVGVPTTPDWYRAMGQRNDALVLGQSQLVCYHPMFGYGLENMPRGPLRPGPALAEVALEALNVKNPACYLFPAENGCVPGAHFTPRQREDAERFLRYEPFAFRRPLRQRAADLATQLALIFAALIVAGSIYLNLRRVWTSGDAVK